MTIQSLNNVVAIAALNWIVQVVANGRPGVTPFRGVTIASTDWLSPSWVPLDDLIERHGASYGDAHGWVGTDLTRMRPTAADMAFGILRDVMVDIRHAVASNGESDEDADYMAEERDIRILAAAEVLQKDLIALAEGRPLSWQEGQAA